MLSEILLTSSCLYPSWVGSSGGEPGAAGCAENDGRGLLVAALIGRKDLRPRDSGASCLVVLLHVSSRVVQVSWRIPVGIRRVPRALCNLFSLVARPISELYFFLGGFSPQSRGQSVVAVGLCGVVEPTVPPSTLLQQCKHYGRRRQNCRGRCRRGRLFHRGGAVAAQQQRRQR